MTGNPYALASALQKFDTYRGGIPMGVALHRPSVHRAAACWGGLRRPVLDPSAYPKRIERLTGRPAEFSQ